jgi:hypothetical protein
LLTQKAFEFAKSFCELQELNSCLLMGRMVSWSCKDLFEKLSSLFISNPGHVSIDRKLGDCILKDNGVQSQLSENLRAF